MPDIVCMAEVITHTEEKDIGGGHGGTVSETLPTAYSLPPHKQLLSLPPTGTFGAQPTAYRKP